MDGGYSMMKMIDTIMMMRTHQHRAHEPTMRAGINRSHASGRLLLSWASMTDIWRFLRCGLSMCVSSYLNRTSRSTILEHCTVVPHPMDVYRKKNTFALQNCIMRPTMGQAGEGMGICEQYGLLI